MKTHILRLESQDTATSICDKMTWAKAPRVLLVFPRRRPPQLNRLELTIILRNANNGGHQLAILTVDRQLSKVAQATGIPVFSSIVPAERLPWRSRRKKPPILPSPDRESRDLTQMRRGLPPDRLFVLSAAGRLAIFILALVAVIAVIVLLLPSAMIIIPVDTKTQNLTLRIYPGENVPGVRPGGQIPARQVAVTVTGQLEAQSTGRVTVPESSAEAVVTVTNQSDQAVVVQAGTGFLTTGEIPIRFSVVSTTDLPAGVGQQIMVKVQADQPGEAGNVAAEAIQAVEGPIGLQIQVTNPEAAEGGTDRTGLAPSDQDYSQMYDRLLTSLTENAKAGLEQDAGSQNTLIPGSLKVEQILQQSHQPDVGQPADRAKLTLTLKFSGLSVRQADLESAAQAGLDAVLPEGWSANPASLNFHLANPVNILPANELALDLVATRSIYPFLDTGALLRTIRGKSLSTAATVIHQQLTMSQTPVFRLNPAWWPVLPWLAFRIAVVSQ